MKSMFIAAAATALLTASPTFATEIAPASSPDLIAFRSAYLAGTDLAYIEIKNEGGVHIFRYGDVSRKVAQQEPNGFLMFTCYAPHVFATDIPDDKATLAKARIVHQGEAGFTELDAAYVADCHNPLVKSAVGQPPFPTI